MTITTEDVIKYINAFTFLSCQAAAESSATTNADATNIYATVTTGKAFNRPVSRQSSISSAKPIGRIFWRSEGSRLHQGSWVDYELMTIYY